MSRQPIEPARRTGWATCMTACVLTICFVGLFGRVVYLQYQPAPQISVRLSHFRAQTPVMARRGQLKDRHGRVIAASRLAHRLFADPQQIEDPMRFAADIAHAIGDDPARIDQLVHAREDGRYVVVNALLNDQQFAAVRRLRLAGMGTQPRFLRQYPLGALAGQVVGFVGTDGGGLEGLEFALDGRLQGRDGQLPVLRDGRRRAVWVERAGYRPPVDGPDIRLSIDVFVQRIAEQELDLACRKYRAGRGELIVMHARSGQILALANWPLVGPDTMSKRPGWMRRNRCATDAFEPGSMFKPFVFATALGADLADPDEQIDCEEGLWVVRGRTLHDSHPFGTLSFDEVLIKSSNIGMGKVGLRMGRGRLYATTQAFGFGQLTGSGLPGESPGIVNRRSTWTDYSLTSIPMGQEIAVTPLQLVRAFSAFANGGLMVTPSILREDERWPIHAQVTDGPAADHVRDVLRRVVSEGTGQRGADSPHYRIWGKTGTAQVPDSRRGGYIPDAYTASFICGAPLDDPQVIVLAVVHQPDKSIGYYGGTVAAPVARAVVERTLTYLSVAPDADDTSDATLQYVSAD